MDTCLLDKGSLGYLSSLEVGQSRFQRTECEAISRIRVILQNQQHNYDVPHASLCMLMKKVIGCLFTGSLLTDPLFVFLYTSSLTHPLGNPVG
jgi:hypothetical protein